MESITVMDSGRGKGLRTTEGMLYVELPSQAEEIYIEWTGCYLDQGRKKTTLMFQQGNLSGVAVVGGRGTIASRLSILFQMNT